MRLSVSQSGDRMGQRLGGPSRLIKTSQSLRHPKLQQFQLSPSSAQAAKEKLMQPGLYFDVNQAKDQGLPFSNTELISRQSASSPIRSSSGINSNSNSGGFVFSEHNQKLYSPYEYLHYATKVNGSKEQYLNALQQLGYEQAQMFQSRPLHEIMTNTGDIIHRSYSVKYMGIIDGNMGILTNRKRIEAHKKTKYQELLQEQEAQQQQIYNDEISNQFGIAAPFHSAVKISTNEEVHSGNRLSTPDGNVDQRAGNVIQTTLNTPNLLKPMSNYNSNVISGNNASLQPLQQTEHLLMQNQHNMIQYDRSSLQSRAGASRMQQSQQNHLKQSEKQQLVGLEFNQPSSEQFLQQQQILKSGNLQDGQQLDHLSSETDNVTVPVPPKELLDQPQLKAPQPQNYMTYLVGKYSLPRGLKSVKKTRDPGIQELRVKLEQWHASKIKVFDNNPAEQQGFMKQAQFQKKNSQNSQNPLHLSGNGLARAKTAGSNVGVRMKASIYKKPVNNYEENLEEGICYAIIDSVQAPEGVSYSKLLSRIDRATDETSQQQQQQPQNNSMKVLPRLSTPHTLSQKSHQQKPPGVTYEQNQNMLHLYEHIESKKCLKLNQK